MINAILQIPVGERTTELKALVNNYYNYSLDEERRFFGRVIHVVHKHSNETEGIIDIVKDLLSFSYAEFGEHHAKEYSKLVVACALELYLIIDKYPVIERDVTDTPITVLDVSNDIIEYTFDDVR